MRALIVAAMADGLSTIVNPLPSPDTDRMIAALESFGAKFFRRGNVITIEGTGRKISNCDRVIDAGNSGIVFRFCAAIAALSPAKTTLTGDESILNRRPIAPLFSALKQLGAKIDGMTVQGPISGGTATLDGADSQPVSALLFACSLLTEKTTLHVTNPGEKPWIDMTLAWLPCRHENYERYEISPKQFSPIDYCVPADFSSALFPLAASVITGQEIEIENLDFTDLQGDKDAIPILQKMPEAINVNRFIDALPILATVACFQTHPVKIFGGEIARKKESDRISAITLELRKMGAKIEEHKDGMTVFPSKLVGTTVSSHDDHRIALSLICAGLGADGVTTIEGAEVCKKTFPDFYEKIAPKCLTLYGFKGAGKTTLGSALAEELGCHFLDTDDLLEDPRKLYEELGEEKFREREKEAILSLRFEQPTVIALGGGAILDRDIEKFCRSLGEMIYLDVPYETILARKILPERFTRKLYDERKEKYEAIASGIESVR